MKFFFLQHFLYIKAVGSLHPILVELYKNIALCYTDLNSMDDASPYIRRALVTCIQLRGIDDETKEIWDHFQSIEVFMDSGLHVTLLFGGVSLFFCLFY